MSQEKHTWVRIHSTVGELVAFLCLEHGARAELRLLRAPKAKAKIPPKAKPAHLRVVR